MSILNILSLCLTGVMFKKAAVLVPNGQEASRLIMITTHGRRTVPVGIHMTLPILTYVSRAFAHVAFVTETE